MKYEPLDGYAADLLEICASLDLQDVILVGYLTTDDASRITAVNDTFLRWSGYSRTNLVGSRLQTLMPVGDQRHP